MMYGWIFGLVLIVLILWYFGRRGFRGNNRQMQSKSPMDILKERFARGEISEEEFNREMEILKDSK